MIARKVDSRVGNVRNDDEGCIASLSSICRGASRHNGPQEFASTQFESVPLSNSGGFLMATPKILLVDDTDSVRASLTLVLKHSGFEVVAAANVNEALRLIGSQKFDVLLSDLHMPNAGDGLTVVSAMRHSNPKAVTLLLSAFPAMGAAAQPILLQADEILVKPMNVQSLIDTIRHRIALGPPRSRLVESVAAILERSSE